MKNETIKRMRAEMLDVLENNILRFWLDKMVDRENGGFYGRMDGHLRLYPEAEKGAILNARILWAFSAAYRILNSQPYLEAATRVKDYFIAHFIDHEYGGVYWSLDYKGQPLDTKKQFYAIGFAVYGLSEYARATGDREALDYALQLYDCIEVHAFDREHNGYIEALTRDWQTIADMRLSELDANYPKSQNTHLHIIEPYTNLIRALKESVECRVDNAVANSKLYTLNSKLKNLIDIFTDHILNPETHHLDLFFEMDWTRGGGQTESYGHDIECSWLMHEAAMVLGDKKVLAKVEPIVLMVAKASEKGIKSPDPTPSRGGEESIYLCEKGNPFEPPTEVNTPFPPAGGAGGGAVWWIQAENVVGWLNIYQHFGDEEALRRAVACWTYIKQNLIDYEHGEWYWSRHSDGTLNLDDDRAGFWKCPYHNSRMCLETIERFASNNKNH